MKLANKVQRHLVWIQELVTQHTYLLLFDGGSLGLHSFGSGSLDHSFWLAVPDSFHFYSHLVNSMVRKHHNLLVLSIMSTKNLYVLWLGAVLNRIRDELTPLKQRQGMNVYVS